MKEIRNKVIMSALVLAFAIIATIGTTFAWFTISNTVQVTSLELNVKAENNLLIRVWDNDIPSLNPNDYKTTLTVADILTSSQYSGFADYRITPSTALNGTTLNAKALNVFSDVATREYSPAIGNSTAGHFIELKFWVMVQTGEVAGKTLGMKDIVITAGNVLPTQDQVVQATFLAAWLESGSAEIYRKDFADYSFTFMVGQSGHSTTLFNRLNEQQAGLENDLVALHVDYLDSNLGTLLDTTPQLLTIRIYVEGWDTEANNNIIASLFNISFVLEIK
jgi:hypothetical protein